MLVTASESVADDIGATTFERNATCAGSSSRSEPVDDDTESALEEVGSDRTWFKDFPMNNIEEAVWRVTNFGRSL
jgi:hypothetical protein